MNTGFKAACLELTHNTLSTMETVIVRRNLNFRPAQQLGAASRPGFAQTR